MIRSTASANVAHRTSMQLFMVSNPRSGLAFCQSTEMRKSNT